MTDEKRGKPIHRIYEERTIYKKEYMTIYDPEKPLSKPSLLLHSCCGPCSTAVVERLVEDYEVTIFFYNPNITDEEEYERRREAQKSFVRQFNGDPAYPYKIGYLEGPYNKEKFYRVAEKLGDQPEGCRRCENCFWLRLEETAQTASMNKYDLFATTLTVSPHKDYKVISAIGGKLAAIYNVGFLDFDFKKKAGFQRSIQLSKKYDLYRQNYCGCEYSVPQKREEEKE
ncbi:MAG: epoxyqueuosine reductase QueH [Anaerovoracaceae bacterium]